MSGRGGGLIRGLTKDQFCKLYFFFFHNILHKYWRTPFRSPKKAVLTFCKCEINRNLLSNWWRTSGKNQIYLQRKFLELIFFWPIKEILVSHEFWLTRAWCTWIFRQVLQFQILLTLLLTRWNSFYSLCVEYYMTTFEISFQKYFFVLPTLSIVFLK